RARRPGHQERVVRETLENTRVLEQTHLVRQLEIAAAPTQHFRQKELRPRGIESPDGAVHRADLLDPNPDAANLLEVVGEGLEKILSLQSRFPPQSLGPLLQGGEVVHVALDKIADLLGG